MLSSRLTELKTYTRNAILLDGALRQVASLSPEQQENVRTMYEAGLRRAGIADQLADEQSAVASLILYREAFALFATAVVLSRDPGGETWSTATNAPLTTLLELARRGRVPTLPSSIAEAEAILATPGTMPFDGWSTDQLLANRNTVSAAVRFLRNLVEPRTTRELKDSRITRIIVLTVVSLAAIGGIGWRLLRLPNLALNKPVTISERFALSSAPADNSGLVNGRIEASYGIHSALGGGWVMVDLQRNYKLSQVKVFNRSDAFTNDSLPYTMELSQDGKDFPIKSQRTEPFTSSNPWVYDAHGATARYVRVRSNQYVALTELEVYGKR